MKDLEGRLKFVEKRVFTLTCLLILTQIAVILLGAGAIAEEIEFTDQPAPAPILEVWEDTNIAITDTIWQAFPDQQLPGNIIFSVGDEEVLVMSPGKFIVRGETVDDPHKVYEAFLRFMNHTDQYWCAPPDADGIDPDG